MTIEVELNWFVGLDWASEKHQVSILDCTGKVEGERSFAHSGEGLGELCAWLLALTGSTPEAMAIAAPLFGLAAVVLGLAASATIDTPSGPSIVVAAFALFLAVTAGAGLRRAA